MWMMEVFLSSEKNIPIIIEALSRTFKVKYLGKMEHFVGCHIIENISENKILIHR